jgi:hypothetical protein
MMRALLLILVTASLSWGDELTVVTTVPELSVLAVRDLQELFWEPLASVETPSIPPGSEFDICTPLPSTVIVDRIYLRPGADFRIRLTPMNPDPLIVSASSLEFVPRATHQIPVFAMVTQTTFNGVTGPYNWSYQASPADASSVVDQTAHPDIVSPGWYASAWLTHNYFYDDDGLTIGYRYTWQFFGSAPAFSVSDLINLTPDLAVSAGIITIRIPGNKTALLSEKPGYFNVTVAAADGYRYIIPIDFEFLPVVTRLP